MTNLEKLVSGLGGKIDTMPREISDWALGMISCVGLDPDKDMEVLIEDCNYGKHCKDCIRSWLAKEAK